MVRARRCAVFFPPPPFRARYTRGVLGGKLLGFNVGFVFAGFTRRTDRDHDLDHLDNLDPDRPL